jgi:hypothetical protein
MKTIKRELSNVKIDIQNPEEAANQNVGSVTLLFSTTTGENLNFPTTPGII